jgi:hypothetical protein
MKIVAGLPDAIDDLTTLYEELQQLNAEARRASMEAVAVNVQKTRKLLLVTYAGTDDRAHFAERAATFADEIFGLAESPTVKLVQTPHTAPRGTRGTAVLVEQLGKSSTIPSAPRPQPLQKQSGRLIVPLKRNISAADVAFFAISTALIIATGLSVLYYANDTWGSTGDRLAMFVWGSTGTAALAFAKNVLPGVLGSAGGK